MFRKRISVLPGAKN